MNRSTKLFAKEALAMMKAATRGERSFNDFNDTRIIASVMDRLDRCYRGFDRTEIDIEQVQAYVLENTFEDPGQAALMRQSFNNHKVAQN